MKWEVANNEMVEIGDWFYCNELQEVLEIADYGNGKYMLANRYKNIYSMDHINMKRARKIPKQSFNFKIFKEVIQDEHL